MKPRAGITHRLRSRRLRTRKATVDRTGLVTSMAKEAEMTQTGEGKLRDE